jgi:hypothetical protein
MRILATISDMKRLALVIELESGATETIPVRPEFIDTSLEAPCRPFGITWNQAELYIANNEQLLVFDSQLQYLRTLPAPLQTNTHQLNYHAECVWAVSPRTNSLIGVRLNSGFHTLEFGLCDQLLGPYTPRRAAEAKDKHHFNSLLWADDYLFVAAHNFGRPSFINRYQKATLRLDHVQEDVGFSIHGLALHNEELFWISTQTGEIRSSLGYCRRLSRQGYARGFSVTQGYFIVGISEKLIRDERHGGDSWIQVIDRQLGTLVSELHLVDTGSINDLRVLDEYDYGHCVSPFEAKFHSPDGVRRDAQIAGTKI